MSFLKVTVRRFSKVICDRRQQTLVLGGQPAEPLSREQTQLHRRAVPERPELQPDFIVKELFIYDMLFPYEFQSHKYKICM